MSKSMYPTMTAVNSIYACHLTETNGLFPSVYCPSGELWQAQTVQGRCPCDGPIYPCKTDMVSSPSPTFYWTQLCPHCDQVPILCPSEIWIQHCPPTLRNLCWILKNFNSLSLAAAISSSSSDTLSVSLLLLRTYHISATFQWIVI